MKAMVLAAGFGTRLGEITKTTPKCLVDIAGKTILERVVAHLRECGVTSLAINTHYLAEKVEEFVATNDIFKGLEVKIFREEKILGTGGGLKNASEFLSQDADCFLVHNADIFEEFDLSELYQAQKNSQALATLATVKKQTDSCVVTDSTNRWLGLWRESSGTSLPLTQQALTFTGVQCVSSRVFQYMQAEQGEFGIFSTYSQALAKGEFINIKSIGEAYYIDIGTQKDLATLRERLR